MAHEASILATPNGMQLSYGHTVSSTPNHDTPMSNLSTLCVTDYNITTSWQACHLYGAAFDTGQWVKTLQGTRKGTRIEHPQALSAWESSEVIYRYEKPTSKVPKGYMLLPLQAPHSIAMGERITLQLLYDGKPLANVPVAYDDQTRGITDAQGRINIRLRHAGTQHFTATHTRPSTTPALDKAITNITLQFEHD